VVHNEIGGEPGCDELRGDRRGTPPGGEAGGLEGDRPALKLLKADAPYYESSHVLNLAYNVMCGGTGLEDIERFRHDTAYVNALGAELILDPTTAGDFCRRSS
jgi:hypothetical protein